jgi:hypothetical protein
MEATTACFKILPRYLPMEGAKKKNGISGNMAEVQIYTWSFNAISP